MYKHEICFRHTASHWDSIDQDHSLPFPLEVGMSVRKDDGNVYTVVKCVVDLDAGLIEATAVLYP